MTARGWDVSEIASDTDCMQTYSISHLPLPYVQFPRGARQVAPVVSSSVTLWATACQVPLSMGFSRKEYWSELPFPPLGDLPDPGIEPASPTSPTLAGRFFIISTTFQGVYVSAFSHYWQGEQGELLTRNC